MTSSFGTRINPVLGVEEFHNGIDIAVPTGTEVVAIYSGRVGAIGLSETFGYFMFIYLDNGYRVMYAHLDEILLPSNTYVQQSDVVALSGNTGLSTAPHLHYSLWRGDELVDPVYYILDIPYTQNVVNERIARGDNTDEVFE